MTVKVSVSSQIQTGSEPGLYLTPSVNMCSACTGSIATTARHRLHLSRVCARSRLLESECEMKNRRRFVLNPPPQKKFKGTKVRFHLQGVSKPIATFLLPLTHGKMKLFFWGAMILSLQQRIKRLLLRVRDIEAFSRHLLGHRWCIFQTPQLKEVSQNQHDCIAARSAK